MNKIIFDSVVDAISSIEQDNDISMKMIRRLAKEDPKQFLKIYIDVTSPETIKAYKIYENQKSKVAAVQYLREKFPGMTLAETMKLLNDAVSLVESIYSEE